MRRTKTGLARVALLATFLMAFTALNVAYEEREKRSLLRLNLVALLFTLGGMVGVVLALTVIVVVPTALAFTWLGPLASAAVRACSFALLLGFVSCGAFLGALRWLIRG